MIVLIGIGVLVLILVNEQARGLLGGLLALLIGIPLAFVAFEWFCSLPSWCVLLVCLVGFLSPFAARTFHGGGASWREW